MNIASLFLNLGIRGSEKTLGALSGMQKGLKGASSMSLEAKAAIVGVFYAFQRLAAQSNQYGTDLTHFNALLGVSTQTLQEYQYAALQVGVSNKEVEGTFKNLQSVMTKTLLFGDAPKGLARLSQIVGDISAGDLKRFSKKPDQLIQKKLQEYAQKESDIGLRNETLRSFGLGDGMIAALQKDAFRPEILARAPKYSEGELESLHKADVAWANLAKKIEIVIGRLNAKFGPELVDDISKVVTEMGKLLASLAEFSDKAKVFETLGLIIKGLSEIIGLGNKVIDSLFSDGISKTAGKILSGGSEVLTGNALTLLDALGQADISKNAGKILSDGSEVLTSNALMLLDALGQTDPTADPLKKMISKPHGLNNVLPFVPKEKQPNNIADQAANSQNIKFEQVINFSSTPDDPHRVGDAVKKSIRDAFRQMQAQAQGS